MKRLSIGSASLLVLALSVSACSSDKSPTNPSDNNTVKFTAALLPGNETPPIVPPNADATASGLATITLHLTRDGSQNITAANADFAVTLQNFPANTNVTLAHIHPGKAGESKSPIVNLSLGAGEVVLNATGGGSISKSAIAVTPDVATDMINNSTGYYFNVHTALNGGGAIRGQLAKQ